MSRPYPSYYTELSSFLLSWYNLKLHHHEYYHSSQSACVQYLWYLLHGKLGDLQSQTRHTGKQKTCPTRNQTWILVGLRLYFRCYWASYPSITFLAGCQNSTVSILFTWWATWYRFQFPISLFPNCSDQLWGQPSLPFNWHQELFFLWVKRLGCEVHYSSPPHAFMVWTGTTLLLVLPSPLPF